MPSRRDLIRMTPEEVRAYLHEQRRIILVTIGSDGMPQPVPMNYGLDPEGRILLTSFRKSQKVVNLRRDPRATLLVESGESYAQLKSVILYCTVELLEAAEDIAANLPQLRASLGLAQAMTPAMQTQIRDSMAKRVIIRATPHRTVSWDHAKLGGHY